MQRVQGCGCWRRHPRSIGAGFRVANLGFHHCRHQIRHCPHTLTNLSNTFEACLQTDINVPLLVGLNPGCRLDITLADDRACFHGGMNFITGAIKETGVNEYTTVLGSFDTRLEINCRATLFVHDANFQCKARQTQCTLNTAEELVGERNFFRTMHFRLNDVHAAGL